MGSMATHTIAISKGNTSKDDASHSVYTSNGSTKVEDVKPQMTG